jgi:hypothetical protein
LTATTPEDPSLIKPEIAAQIVKTYLLPMFEQRHRHSSATATASQGTVLGELHLITQLKEQLEHENEEKERLRN